MFKLPKTMTKITFTHGVTIEAQSVHVNTEVDTVFAGGGHSYDAYALYDIKEIIPPKQKAPTKFQLSLTNALLNQDYKWEKGQSLAAAGVVVKRESDGDFWFFGMEGEIMHNPETLLSIKL